MELERIKGSYGICYKEVTDILIRSEENGVKGKLILINGGYRGYIPGHYNIKNSLLNVLLTNEVTV